MTEAEQELVELAHEYARRRAYLMMAWDKRAPVSIDAKQLGEALVHVRTALDALGDGRAEEFLETPLAEHMKGVVQMGGFL